MRADLVRRFLVPTLLVGLAGCTEPGPQPILGTLEWDRIAVTAELAEPVLRWAVAEGDRVEAGAVLLEQDASRQETRIAEARSQLASSEARLEELANGARIETIDAARAELARARAALADAEIDDTRASELNKQKLASDAVRDQARANLNQRRAETDAAAAQLRELTQGTRPEQIDQATGAVDAARAALATLELTRDRLIVRAPRAGRVDALPFRAGDQPPLGAALVSLLVGDAPYARVFIPAPRRAEVGPGTRFEVQVEGVATPFPAALRSIRSEPSFTPYYALVGDDASRLVYQAELVLEGGAQLPAGLPLTAVVR